MTKSKRVPVALAQEARVSAKLTITEEELAAFELKRMHLEELAAEVRKLEREVEREQEG